MEARRWYGPCPVLTCHTAWLCCGKVNAAFAFNMVYSRITSISRLKAELSHFSHEMASLALILQLFMLLCMHWK
uniref:Uncharacterized protein n=1 Tax=Ixodes ricinus TaxID=34613 RepID=A0A6B0TUZ4_IXORI